MEHITVLTSTPPPTTNTIDYTSLIVEQSYSTLSSLIDAFKSKEFGYDTTFQTSLKIRKFIEYYIEHSGKKIFIDSSGYSIIKGDVARWDIPKVIDCYHEYVEHEWEVFDYIFSLDIPFNKNFPRFNNYQDIKDANRESLSKSRNLLEQYPALADKFYFIYQFKCKELFHIWDSLWHELELAKIVKNWSLGGMVSLKTMAKISFSPFIGMTFRCLFDYLNSPDPDPVFKLHFLGIYQRVDRFFIAFLEKLIQSYSNGNFSTLFTYDSINYIRQSQMVNKKLTIFEFDSNILNSFTMNDVPDHLLSKVYNTDDYLDGFHSELERVNNGNKADNISVFAPLNICSNINIDRLFEHLIDQENMIYILSNATSVDHVKVVFSALFKKLAVKYPDIFTRIMIKSIITNLQITFEFHRWYRDKRDKGSLDNLVLGFIKIINLKGIIRE